MQNKYQNFTDMLVKFTKGEITEVDDIIEFSQQLVDNGLDVKSNGTYSQLVQKLIDLGKVSPDKRLKSISWLKNLKLNKKPQA